MANQQLLDLHVARLRNPPKSNERGRTLEKQVESARIVRLDKAKVTQPYFLPFLESGQKFTILLDGVANSVTQRYTPPSSSPTLITGFTSDFDLLKVRVTDVLQSPTWSDFPVGARDFAGVSANLAGNHGYQDLFEPFELIAMNQLVADIVNIGGLAVRRWLVAEGIKVSQLRDVSLDVFDEQDAKAIRQIENGVVPRNVDLVLDVPFTGGANQVLENRATKVYNSPLLIWGISTNLKNCSIEIWDSADNRWMPSAVPIWSVANFNAHASGRGIHYLPKPFYHPAGVELRANLVNTFDPTLASDNPTDGGRVVFHGSTP